MRRPPPAALATKSMTCSTKWMITPKKRFANNRSGRVSGNPASTKLDGLLTARLGCLQSCQTLWEDRPFLS